MKIIGKEKIKTYLLDIFNFPEDKNLYSILIGKPIVYYFGEDFAENFMAGRCNKNIYLKSLRVTKNNFDTIKHKNYTGYNKEIKHIESNIFDKSMFLYGKKVLIFNMDKFELEVIDNENKFNFYLNKFNELWKK